MTSDLLVPVNDLIGNPGKQRPFAGEKAVLLRLGETVADGPMTVAGEVIGLIDAVRAHFTVSAQAHLSCTRCLTEWDEMMKAEGDQVFRLVLDEDGYGIVDGEIDISGPAQDELALSLPIVSLCTPDCKGLCPTCGTDLNTDPCDGHGEDPDSPFAVLKDLFDS
ncbi:MAG: YceD family protein [Acidimicrobiia bacterium]